MFWLSALPIREWYGVTTNDSGRVTRLEFIDNRLNGEIPPELGNLSDLQELYINDSWVKDRLNGEIPPELGKLANLRVMDLRGQSLSGGIPPELGSLINL